MDENEIKILQQLKLGNRQSYSRLFETYYPVLCAFAFKYLSDLDTSKEIVQDLFVSIYERRSSLVINTSLKSYLFQSVKNRAYNYLSKKRTEEKHHKLISLQDSGVADLNDQLTEVEMEQEVFRTIEKLAPRCREIFVMSRIDGMRNGQIADELGVSIRTVETQISNALKEIRYNLRQYYQS